MIQDNLNDMAQRIEDEKATDMKDIAHHAQHPIVLQLGNRQPAASPDHDIVSQRAQQHQHLLGLKALLVAFGQPQSGFVPFEGRFDAASTLIVEVAEKRLDAVARIDNRGTEARGPWQYLGSASVNNIFGAHEALPRGQARLRFHPIMVVVGEPIFFTEADLQPKDKDLYRRLSQRVMDAIAQLHLE